MDAIIKYLEKLGLPITRDNYVLLNWVGDADPKQPLPAELEASLPKNLQLKAEKE
jgi:hypothetical protein